MIRGLKKGVVGGLVLIMMLSLFLAACSKKEEAKEPQNETPAANGDSGKEPAKEPEKAPEEMVKIRIEKWDRGNAPAGAKFEDNVAIKKIQEELKKIGLDVEYALVPRAQESEKISTWLASGEAPDAIITYDAATLFKFAEQGGLWELDEVLDKYGPDLKEVSKKALEQAGTYKGKRYAIPAYKPDAFGGAHMKIRKDWLDKVGLPIPTTIEELYTVLKAFKEQDPGKVGKDKVVPWALPSMSQGTKGFFYGAMTAFGIGSDGPGNQVYMNQGSYKDGKFTYSIASPEGKEFFKWMNQLYQEGLISKEFVTDVNSQKFIEQVNGGTAGFIDSNNPAYDYSYETRKSVPEATWVTVPPLKRPDGSQMIAKSADFGLFVMVPKTSKHPEAVIKYLNWMVKPENMRLVQNGIEGVHWKMENGLPVTIDGEKNKEELWTLAANDLSIAIGGPLYDRDQLLALNSANKERYPTEKEVVEYVDNVLQLRDIYTNYPWKPASKLFTEPRPFAQKNGTAIENFLYEAVSKLIIAKDFEKEYESVLAGWDKIGGHQYEQEIADGLKAMGY